MGDVNVSGVDLSGIGEAVGAYAQPADTLVDRVFRHLGLKNQPELIIKLAQAQAYAKVHLAQADAQVRLIQENAELQVLDMKHAAQRTIEVEAERHLINIGSVTAKALPFVEAGSSPDEIDQDWWNLFFAKCRDVSSEQMQSVWGRILAGEANAPGTYSKRTVDFLSTFDKSDAVSFESAMRFVASVEEHDKTLLIFEHNDAIYREAGLRYTQLAHLESIGLIKKHSEFLTSVNLIELPKRIFVSYADEKFTLTFEEEEGNSLPIGNYTLTVIGSQLARICNVVPVEGFTDYLRERWAAFLPSEKDTIRDGDQIIEA